MRIIDVHENDNLQENPLVVLSFQNYRHAVFYFLDQNLEAMCLCYHVLGVLLM